MRLRKPKGADPVPRDYAQRYAQSSYDQLPEAKLELRELLGLLGGCIEGWRVLDLGGGPGHFSALLAEAGAEVTWHDISLTYRTLAQEWCRNASVRVNFEIGHLDDLSRYPPGSFDLIFCRLCWYYADDELRFYRRIRALVKPGRYGWVRTHNLKLMDRQQNPLIRWAFYGLYGLHEITGLKLAHVPARATRLRRWFFDSGDYDQIFFEEKGASIKLLGVRREPSGN
jgi:2-polyprenyl-3-methyl-5-hydroxy-6-metoxy-1,4-benzoquinol methylase